MSRGNKTAPRRRFRPNAIKFYFASRGLSVIAAFPFYFCNPLSFFFICPFFLFLSFLVGVEMGVTAASSLVRTAVRSGREIGAPPLPLALDRITIHLLL